MLRQRSQARGVARTRAAQTLATPVSQRVHSYALRYPTRPKLYLLNVSFALNTAGTTHIDYLGSDYDLLDLEASVGQCRLHDDEVESSLLDDDESVRYRCMLCERDADEESQCSACEQGRYCSSRCRKNDRWMHERVCGKIERLTAEPRPSSYHHCVFYFPTDREKPEAIWLRAEFSRTEGNITFRFDQKEIQDWAEERVGGLQSWQVPLASQSKIINKRLGHGVLLLGLGCRGPNGPEDVNTCHRNLAKPGQIIEIFGPMFVVGYEVDPVPANFKRFHDVNLRDLQHCVDLILQNPHNPVVPAPERSRLQRKPALMVNHLNQPWNIKAGVRDLVIPVCIQEQAPDCSDFPIAKAFEMGLRWYIRPLPVPEAVESGVRWQPFTDGAARLFHHVVWLEKEHVDDFGEESRTRTAASLNAHFYHMEFWRSVLIHHLYGHAIHPMHVHAAIEFVRRVEDDGQALNQSQFENFWAFFRDREVKRGNLIQHVPSPYEAESQPPSARGMVPSPEAEGLLRLLKERQGISVQMGEG